MADDPNRPTRIDDQPEEGEMIENAMDFIDTENNEGELVIALGHIRRLNGGPGVELRTRGAEVRHPRQPEGLLAATRCCGAVR